MIITTKRRDKMAEKRAVDHTNVFESYLAKEVFMMDIIDKVVDDWKRTDRKSNPTREELEDFFYDTFIHEWIGYSVETWLDEEFESEDEDEEE
jgi:hypothetical protein